MTIAEQPWRAGKGCVIVRVRLTPKSSIEGVDGVIPSAEGQALATRVRAVPAEGEANAAVEKLIARWLDVPKSSVRVTAGGKSRIKSLTISGETDCLERRLMAKLAGAS
ncbi:hypothetical protein GIW81_12230 [Hyphomicrobium sp. xq]|uniref:UPF0235 protein GIW81_12230 n=1 Tax=Hyphomicrobium album TaxID=2665159 RepID=A0A6I3KKW5_9HYPH|nr:DUF167 family protein [Hyphomicrobium album]MTD95099.1 hypothetical protein [Hyphomicrobium album]